MTKEAASQLAKHLEKTESELQHPRIRDTVLTANERWVLSQLELERNAARDKQGYPERVRDWWAAPTMVGKKKRKGKRMGKKQGAMAGEGVSVEGLRDNVGALGLGEREEMAEEMDEEEGGVLVEEEYEGFESPVAMSLVGSVGGDGEKKDEEEL